MASDEFKGPYTIEHVPVESDEAKQYAFVWVLYDKDGRFVSDAEVLALLNRSPTGLTAWVPTSEWSAVGNQWVSGIGSDGKQRLFRMVQDNGPYWHWYDERGKRADPVVVRAIPSPPEEAVKAGKVGL